jgi:hypothetical protein
MLTIIHGSDTTSSRKYFFDQKEKLENSGIINGQAISLTDLLQLFEGGELFAQPKNFFIESLIGKRKKSAELEKLVETVNRNSAEHEIFIWEGRELTPAAVKQFKNAADKVFKLPQTLFTFLDNIKPGNGKALIRLFHQTLESSDAEMIFFMMIRQIRLMLFVKEPGEMQIEEIKRMSWQMGKLRAQAAGFDIDQLKTIYARLFEIEKGLKTGTLSTNLEQTIDLLLLDI